MARTGGPDAPAWLGLLLLGGAFLFTALLTAGTAAGARHLVWVGPVGALAGGAGLWLLASRVGEWVRGEEPLPSPWWGLGFGVLALSVGKGVLRVNAVSQGPAHWNAVGWLITACGALGVGVAVAILASWWIGLRRALGSSPTLARRLQMVGEADGFAPVLLAVARRLVEFELDASASQGLQRVVGRTSRGARVSAKVQQGVLELGVELPRQAGPFELTPDQVADDLGQADGPVPIDDALDGEGALRLLFATWKARRLWTDGRWLRVELGVAPASLAPAWADEAVEVLRRLPDLVEPIRAIVGDAPAGAPASPRAALLRVLPRWLDMPRVEVRPEDGEDLVSGRREGRNVTLRLAPDGVTLSFDLPFRAAFDLTRDDLPADVRAAVDGGPAVEGDPDAALVTLFAPLGCQRLRAHARRAHATLPLPTGDAEGWAERALGLVARLDGLARSPVVLTARRVEQSSAVCPYCRDAADVSADDVAPCEGCGTLHHAECLEEGGGCTVLGCAKNPRRSRPVRVT